MNLGEYFYSKLEVDLFMKTKKNPEPAIVTLY